MEQRKLTWRSPESDRLSSMWMDYGAARGKPAAAGMGGVLRKSMRERLLFFLGM